MNHPLQCQCGTIKGHVVVQGLATRAVCYCKDCRAFANFLERPDTVGEQGGVSLIATLPGRVHFSQGLEALACMSLSDRGMLRWYASCCKTPIGNTPRDFKTPYIGLVESCLTGSSPSVQESFGPVRMVLNTQYAEGSVKSKPVGNLLALVRIMSSVIVARLRGAYKHNPFFAAETGKPVRQPRELTQAERERVTN